MGAKILEGTFVGILVFLLVTNAQGAAAVIDALASGYSNSVKALQGRS